MATILAYTSPAAGHAFPAAAILDELHQAGHDVIIRTHEPLVPILNSHGRSAEPIDARIASITLDDWRARTQPGALKASVRTFAERARFDGEDLQQAISEHRPDALLVDVNCWGAAAAAQRWGGPWAMFCPYPLAMSSKQAPPFGLGLAPAENAIGRLRDTVLRPLVYGSLGRTMLPGINGVRSEMGLPSLVHLDDQFREPPLLLHLSAEPFEYARDDWPGNLVQVGPCEWEPHADVLDGLRDDVPLVLVTSSSEFQNDERLLKAAATGLAEEPVQVVLTGPSHGALTDLPANAVATAFAAHGPLLDRAVCAVTHAGMGATQKALARGVPVVAVPFGRDQFEVARRVAVADAGVRLSKRHLNPGTLRRAVALARTKRSGALRVAEGFGRAGGARAAARVFEQRLFTAPVPRN